MMTLAFASCGWAFTRLSIAYDARAVTAAGLMATPYFATSTLANKPSGNMQIIAMRNTSLRLDFILSVTNLRLLTTSYTGGKGDFLHIARILCVALPLALQQNGRHIPSHTF